MTTNKCPKCGNEVQDDAVFCDQCGTRLPEKTASTPEQPSVAPAATPEPAVPAAAPAQTAAEVTCPACGARNLPGEAFCQDCGAKLAAPTPVAAAPETASSAPVAAGVCPDCGASTAPDEEFCFACGADLASARARVSSQQGTPMPAVETAQPAASVEPQPVVAQAPEAKAAVCQTCGAEVKDGDAFCEACGAALASGAAAAPASAQAAQPAAAAQVRLVVVASGVELPLGGRVEVVVGREDPYSGVFPDIDLTPHGGVEGGVSRRHFKVTFSGGKYLIEDLNSTNFTMVNRVRIQPGSAQPLADGDEIAAGRVKLLFKVGA